MEVQPAALDLGMARGLVVFRWLALGWAWVGLVLQTEELRRWWLAVLLLAVATAVTVSASLALTDSRRDRYKHTHNAIEVGIAGILLLAEPLVFDATRDQSLAWAWPAAGIIAVAIAAGWVWGIASAAGLSVAGFVGESLLREDFAWTTGTASKAALLVLAALSASMIADVLRAAEQEISTARAREQMGRVLHDGVLQTLAVIQRRSADDELRALASEQERDLRAFLFERPRALESLAVQLRTTIDTVARRHGVEIGVVVADDLLEPSPEIAAALAGAAGEAATNAAKHAGLARISVYAEPTDSGGVYCSIRDNGAGFDPEAAVRGEGLTGSIEQRMKEVGGRAQITSKRGRGTEVQLWTTD